MEHSVHIATNTAVDAALNTRHHKNSPLQNLCSLLQLQDQNCLPEILDFGCNATAAEWATIEPFIPVLLSSADRCVGYPPPTKEICPGRVTLSNTTAANATNATIGVNATSLGATNTTAAGPATNATAA